MNNINQTQRSQDFNGHNFTKNNSSPNQSYIKNRFNDNQNNFGNHRNFEHGNDHFNPNRAVDEGGGDYKRTQYCKAGQKFSKENLLLKTQDVTISYFINPTKFYCRLKYRKYDEMTKEIQRAYIRRRPYIVKFKGPIIAQFQDDQRFYRAEVLEYNNGVYKVRFVDYGNVSLTKNVFLIETRFMELPVQAYRCSLGSLTPLKEKWPNVDQFDTYIAREFYQSNFLAFQNDVYTVNLRYNGINLKDEIISNNLATYTVAGDPASTNNSSCLSNTSPNTALKDISSSGLSTYLNSTEVTRHSMKYSSTEDIGYSNIESQSTCSSINFEYNLLPFQTLHGVIVSVKNVSNISLQLETGNSVQCEIHNVHSATRIWEARLRRYVSQKVITYIHSVFDEILRVTFYDTMGQKINVIETNQNEIEEICPVCPLPIFTNQITGYVSHADNTLIYLQPNIYEAKVTQFIDEFGSYYNSMPYEEVFPIIDEIYAVHCKADGNWYRGKVLIIQENNVSVQYIDFGNTDTAHISCLRTLTSKFYEPHMLAVQVFIENQIDLLENIVTIHLTRQKVGWVGKVDTVKDLETLEEVQAKEFEAIVSFFEDPHQFYLQLADKNEEVENLQERLNEIINALPVLADKRPGKLCAAQYLLDMQWYRAVILEKNGDVFTVNFIDFGNVEFLEDDAVLKELPEEFSKCKPYALKCKLNVDPITENWSKECSLWCERTMLQGCLNAKILERRNDIVVVRLYIGNLDIGQKLIEENFAVTPDSKVGSCFVTHVVSPSEFYIMPESEVEKFNIISKQLQRGNFCDTPDSLLHGSLCAALYTKDKCWYRGIIVGKSQKEGYIVHFIDQGVTSEVTALRKLSKNLAEIPGLVQKCQLKKPIEIHQWCQSSINKFNEMCYSKQKFSVIKLQEGGTWTVQLFSDGKDIASSLILRKFEAYITNYKSSENFSIQPLQEIDILTPCRYVNSGLSNVTTATKERILEKWTKARAKVEVEIVAIDVRLHVNGKAIPNDMANLNFDSAEESSSELKHDRINGHTNLHETESRTLRIMQNYIPKNLRSKGRKPDDSDTDSVVTLGE